MAFQYNNRFQGQYYDAETGTHYNYFRDYDPELGRYAQSDPIGLRGGISTYNYVKGNPISYLDPSGLINLVGAIGGSFVPGFGFEGSVGIYITLPQYGKYDFDIGLYGSGGFGPGNNVSLSPQGGYMNGDVKDIRDITYNLNGGAFSGSSTSRRFGRNCRRSIFTMLCVTFRGFRHSHC